jgi:glycosyltransferase involved in cell wall biosynthesis
MGPPPQGDKHDRLRALPAGVDVIVTNLALEWLDPEGNDVVRARSELLRIAERVQPDLVHLNSFREGALAWPCPAIVVAHSCVLSWWEATRNGRPHESRWRAYAQAVTEGLNAANAWVAPTQAFRRTIQSVYAPMHFGHVVANGVAPVTAALSGKDNVILASGRIWDGGKNLMALAEAASTLAYPVQIAGAGMDKDAGPNVRNVEWLGELDHADLRKRMQRAAIYAAPALYEPFGLGVLEAASAGCALVLSDIPSLKELWDAAAVYVAPGDAAALRTTLRQVCEDETWRRYLQCAAATRARHYTLRRMVTGYMNLYETLLFPPRPARRRARMEVRA